MPRENHYQPVAIELEITTLCGLRCLQCGIINEVKGTPKDLSAAEALDILCQAEELGVRGYAMTGGDPLLRLDEVCTIVAESPLDLCKLAFTGKLFTSEGRAREIFSQLKDAGIASRNKHLKPFFNICIGMQTLAGIPMRNVAIFTKICLETFPNNITMQLNIAQPDGYDGNVWLMELDDEYRDLTGHGYPYDRIGGIVYDLYEIPGQGNEEGSFSSDRITIEDFIKKGGPACLCRNFDPSAIPYFFPRCLVSADGSVYACSTCYKVGAVGNVRTEKLRTILERINADPNLKTIITEGYPAFYRRKIAADPSLLKKEIPVASSICAVCSMLRS